MEITMYDNLLQLPLFQGLCKEDFTTIIERVKLHFLTFKSGETIFKQDRACTQLVFLLSGEIVATTNDSSGRYTLSETIGAPFIVEPFSLFGMKTSYNATYVAKTEVKLMCIDKAYIFTELNNYDIFRINFLNLLSNRCQTIQRKLWDTHIGTIREKFANFMANRCQKPDGEKTLLISMEELGNLIDETRINVSNLLNELQKKEVLQLKRKEIYIPALERFIDELLPNNP